ncbi:MAG: stage 0 sporulation family protein [Chloroflexi bacterium]|nr:stage 0 sporulation family protein [Chloroflexota bacterium]
MPDIVGVRFRRAGKLQFYETGGLAVEVNDYVVADTPRGQEMGWVVITPQQLIASQIKTPLFPIVRKAAVEDLRRRDELKAKEAQALEQCRELAQKHNLPMKLVEAEYILDGKLIFHFGAEDRVDFRNLLKDLNAAFQTKVELRQVGARDEAKLIDGMGRCGRQLCCSTWLTEFSPVSMRMAKEQELPLNAFNLAGACGRLRCCLRYEYEQYREFRRELPKIGEWVITPQGDAKVIVGHPLKQLVSVLVGAEGEQTVAQFPLDQVKRKVRPQSEPAVKDEDEAPAEDEGA